MFVTTLEDRILDLHAAFRSWGYYVAIDAIAGEEEKHIAYLKEALAKVESLAEYLRKHDGYRGKSKALLNALHITMATPAWGIELA